MTIVLAQPALIDEADNAVRLAKYAQLTQHECAFWGVDNPAVPISDACSPIMTLPGREQIARYLGEAQDEIEQVCGFPLSPKWFTETLPYAFTVHSKWNKVFDVGIRATEVVANGVAVSYVADPSIVGPVATTITDPDEIHVYHPGTEIEIDPSDIMIAAGMVTIEIPRCRLVELASIDNTQAGLDYADVPPSATSPFEATVDIGRVYNDPETQAVMIWPHHTNEGAICSCGCMSCDESTHEACEYIRNGETGAIDILYAHLVGSIWTTACSCVCAAPELVQINYRAGLQAITKQAEDAVIHLAHAKMPKPSCGCGIVRDKWDADRVVPENMTAEQAACPFGQSVGSWLAYKFAMAMRIVRMGIL